MMILNKGSGPDNSGQLRLGKMHSNHLTVAGLRCFWHHFIKPKTLELFLLFSLTMVSMGYRRMPNKRF